jgi:hypothetical protein
MNRRILMTVLAVVALGFVTGSTAEAGGGGGGAKKSATIYVNNGQAVSQVNQMAVISLPNGQTPNPAWTSSQFLAAGGQVVSAGASVKPIKLAPGWGNVFTWDSTNLAPVGPAVAMQPYSLSAGKSSTYQIGGTNALPTLTKTN